MMQTISRKSLLYRSGIGGYCLNHVLGCSHGCRFPCHAYLIKKRCGMVKDYAEWTQPKLVGNALELLEKEINGKKRKIPSVMMCLATDPFMYQQPEVAELSLKIIDRLNAAGSSVNLLTKGEYPPEIAQRGTAARRNRYGITLVSLDEEFRKKYEPGTAPYQTRINALKYLHDQGCETYIHMEPYPTPNIIQQDLQVILNAVSFVDDIFLGTWSYNQDVTHFPNRDEFYQSARESVGRFCREHNMRRRSETTKEPLSKADHSTSSQLTLDIGY